MSVGFFTDKSIQPGPEDIKRVLGSCLPLWDELLAHIRGAYHPLEDFKFLYGKNYGWGVRFRLKSKLLTSLYPADGHFKVQVILNPAEVEMVQGMGMGNNITRTIDEATPYPEGRWLFIPVNTSTDIQDILRILELHAGKKQK
jgi:hypothetical protein